MWAWASAGCGSETVYCIAEVRAEDQGQGITDPGFHNPNAVGTTICWGDIVGKSYCRARDGIFASRDDYENGAAPFCRENGFTTACAGGQFYVEPGVTCPASPFTSSTDTALESW